MTQLPETRAPIDLAIPTHNSGFIRVLVTVIGAALLCMWAVVGFLLWIPLMTRMILLFFSAVISTMFTGRDPTHARISLDYAITFYSRGFELIRDSMRGTLHRSGPFAIPEGDHLWRVVRELLFAIFFWVGIFLFWQALTRGLFGWLAQFV